MGLILSILGGGGIGAVVLFAWVVWVGKAEERQRQRREELESIERRLTERGPNAS